MNNSLTVESVHSLSTFFYWANPKNHCVTRMLHTVCNHTEKSDSPISWMSRFLRIFQLDKL